MARTEYCPVGEQKGNSNILAEREGLKIIRDFPEVKSARHG